MHEVIPLRLRVSVISICEAIMATATPVIRKKITGGSFLIEERQLDEVFTPEDFTDEHLPDRADHRRVRAQGNRARGRQAGEKGLGAHPRTAEESQRTRPDLGRNPRSLRRHGHGQGQRRHRRRAHRQVRQLCRDLRRALRHRHAAHRLFRHRRAEAEIFAQAGDGANSSAPTPCRNRPPAPTRSTAAPRPCSHPTASTTS